MAASVFFRCVLSCARYSYTYYFTLQCNTASFEETTEKMQASFRTGDDVETIKKPTNTGKTKRYVSITDINFALSTFLCPSTEQTFVSFYVFRTTMGRPDHYCRSFSGSEQQHLVLFFLSLAADPTGGGKQKLFVSFSHRAVGRG